MKLVLALECVNEKFQIQLSSCCGQVNFILVENDWLNGVCENEMLKVVVHAFVCLKFGFCVS